MKIKVCKDGPYLVSGSVPLIQEKSVKGEEAQPCCWQKVKEFDTKEEYSLCRCGNSKNKPYCDGSHKTSGFVADDYDHHTKYDDSAVEYTGPESTLLDNDTLCSSARFCHRAGSAWLLVEKGDPESEKILAEEVSCCPSGRLVLKDKKDQVKEPKLKEEISVTLDPPADVAGPLWVKGGIEIESSSGETLEKRNRVTLCRCGKSKNKPLCDGSHHDVNFQE